MRTLRVVVLGLMTSAGALPLAAQIPPNAGVRTAPRVPLPRMMVSNPYALRSSDSSTSVTIGTGIRSRMERVANNVYNVMSRDQMNQALIEYSYPPDAILSQGVQRQFAQAVTARVLLSSTMARTQDGHLTVTARLAGLNDDAGSVVVMSQQAGQSPEQFGQALAERFQPVVRASKDAKECVDRRATDPRKASESARKALDTAPNSGLAWYCLAQLAMDAKAPSDSIIRLLSKAAESDPLSLPALALLARQYDERADTAKVVEAYQDMLTAAPLNEDLRKEAFQYFLRVGRTDAARAAVEEALRLDEFNPDLYDLLSNVCVFENNYRCAVDAQEQLYAIDSSKAQSDTTFYIKVSVFASQPAESPDTARLIKWAQAGVTRYPGNITLLNQLLGAYAMQGNMDSTVSVARRLVQADTTSVAPVLLAINELAKRDSLDRARPLMDIVRQRGTPQDKENAAILLVNKAFDVLRANADSGIADTVRLARAADLSRTAVGLVDSTSRLWPSANYALGLSTVFFISKMDPFTERTKSCPMARREDALVQESTAALEKGRSANEAQVRQYLDYLNSLKARTASMIRAFC